MIDTGHFAFIVLCVGSPCQSLHIVRLIQVQYGYLEMIQADDDTKSLTFACTDKTTRAHPVDSATIIAN